MSSPLTADEHIELAESLARKAELRREVEHHQPSQIQATLLASRAAAHAAIATALRTQPVIVTVNEAPRRRWLRK